MAYGYNSQGQLVYLPDSSAPQGGTAMPTSYYAGKGGVIPMDPSDPRYASSRKLDDNGFMSLAMGNPGWGKKYNAAGEIVNTSPWQKFDTAFNDAGIYGTLGMGAAAGAIAGGAALGGAFGGGAGAAGSGGATGFGGAGTGLTMTDGVLLPTAAGASGGGAGAGLGATGDLIFGTGGAGATIGVPAGAAGVGTVGGGAATTVGETVAKQAAKTAAQKAAKKWMTAGAVVAPAVAGLYAANRGKSQPNDINQALTALLAQQSDQMQQEQPLRRLLLGQQAGMLPSYMKQDPQYAQWLQNSAPAAQSAMNAAVARPRFA